MNHETHELNIDPSLDERRLDQALAQLLPSFSRSFLARLVDEGHVTINGSTADRRSRQVRSGDRVCVAVPAAAPAVAQPENLPLQILFQDEDLVVINKAAGIAVHPGAGRGDGTLVNALLHHVRDLSGIGGVTRPGIVHRLDKDTSGVMVIAKNDRAHRALTASWGTSEVSKRYLAVVYGTPLPEAAVIDRPIGRDPVHRTRMAVVAGGRPAVTEYTTVERLRYATLLRCALRTGRTHQIRVHLRFIGHPIIGDPVYSGPQWRGIPDRRLQKVLSALGRQALHAEELAFPHPRTGERLSFRAPLPDDLQNLLDALREKENG